MKWTLLFDAEKCNGCRNCVLATLDGYVDNSVAEMAGGASVTAPALVIEEHERSADDRVDVTFFPKMCQHCADMPCAAAAPEGAVALRPDGIVSIDADKCRGRREMVDACPFGALSWNDARDTPEHWTFDTHLLDAGWKHPRAVQACPTRALDARKMSDDEYSKLAASSTSNPLTVDGTAPGRVLFFNTARVSTAFVTARLVIKDNGIRTALEGAKVSLKIDPGTNLTAVSDPFGDFLFDGIPLNPGRGQLTIATDALTETRDFAFDGVSMGLGRIEIG